jgi:hypothetical protein
MTLYKGKRTVSVVVAAPYRYPRTMTWLSLVTAVTLVIGFTGMGILSMLGASLRVQSAATTRQSSNRRLLALGAGLCAAAVVVPFIAAGWFAALMFAAGWLVLGVLVAAMFATRIPTRMLATLLFLSAALLAVVTLPPHMGTFDTVGAFVIAGLVLAKLTRLANQRITPYRPLH